MGSYLLDSNDLSFLKMHCKTLFIKHLLGTYYNTGTLYSGRTRPFWNYNTRIMSKALESTVGWVPPEADPGTSTCVQLAHEGLASTGDTRRHWGRRRREWSKGFISGRTSHRVALPPNPLTPQWSDKGISRELDKVSVLLLTESNRA